MLAARMVLGSAGHSCTSSGVLLYLVYVLLGAPCVWFLGAKGTDAGKLLPVVPAPSSRVSSLAVACLLSSRPDYKKHSLTQPLPLVMRDAYVYDVHTVIR